MKLDKEQLLSLINKALLIEEESVPNLASHVISALDFLEKNAVLKEKIIAVMELLKKESTEHAGVLKGIIKDIEGRIQDTEEKKKEDK